MMLVRVRERMNADLCREFWPQLLPRREKRVSFGYVSDIAKRRLSSLSSATAAAKTPYTNQHSSSLSLSPASSPLHSKSELLTEKPNTKLAPDALASPRDQQETPPSQSPSS